MDTPLNDEEVNIFNTDDRNWNGTKRQSLVFISQFCLSKVEEKALMAAQIFCTNSSILIPHSKNFPLISTHKSAENIVGFSPKRSGRKLTVQCSENQTRILRTCKNCKTQFDPLLNHPRSCRFHTAHFGGETKRKFESVYTGGTMNTADSGKVYQYWHCCGSEDPFDPGCTAAPHSSYDD